MAQNAQCPGCGAVLTPKNRTKLVAVGVLMIVAAGISARWSVSSAAVFLLLIGLLLIGAYLIVWGTLGRGMWCRQCKKFPMGGV
jgi:hypothetical protein